MAKILVIDDDHMLREMLCEYLSRAGYEVSEAEDGVQGLKAYTDNPTDLVITDLMMPEKSGCETITEMKRSWPDVKIIAISGGNQRGAGDFLPLAEYIGASKTLAKPFALSEVTRAIEDLLQKTA